MSRIVLGASDAKNVSLDVDVLLKTRLLIQGGSGSGKSWLIRRLAEQFFGKLPVIIVDPEGEFASLREKYGYVLVGQGGETPADLRSAGMVAHKLLELHASAVCDIYEMKPADRHLWVKHFLDALIDAPKALWQPAAIIVDEAHLFAPEKGAGESAASEAMIALTTRGRKRGYAPVFATQRLGKLRKDAAAELQNVLIGRTFIDIDRKRAVETLGVAKEDAPAFTHELKTLPEGRFWAFGPAITLERTLVTIGGVETSHPKLGAARKTEPPPAPEKVRALLPKLADLPQQAEQKVLTENELRRQLAEKDRRIREMERAAPAPVAPVAKTESVLTREDWEKLHYAEKRIRAIGEMVAETEERLVSRVLHQFEEKFAQARSVVDGVVAKARGDMSDMLDRKGFRELLDKLSQAKVVVRAGVLQSRPMLSVERISQQSIDRVVREPRRPPAAGSDVNGVGQRILNALAELKTLGANEPRRELVAFLAGYTHLQSKGFVNGLSELRTAGAIDYPSSGSVVLTETGHSLAQYPERPRTPQEVQERVIALLGGASGRILRPVIEAYPRALLRTDVAAAAGYGHLQSKGFVNALSRLSSLGFVRYPDRGTVAAAPVLFLDT